jgi:NEDD8-activating enzyme E1 regulatory subunit
MAAGIGHYTILDSETVSEADLGVNFFLDEESLGLSRAQRCCQLLQELNPDVEGAYSTKTITEIDQQFIAPFNLLLITTNFSQGEQGHLINLVKFAHENNTAVFLIKSIGFFSEFSLLLPGFDFPIIDVHPDSTSTTDLRLLAPWPELSAFVAEKTKDIDTLSDHDHGHIPYLVILLHYLEEWKQSHGGSPPQNYKEKTEFRDLIRSKARTDTAEGGEENFDEAAAAVLKSLNPPATKSGAIESLPIDTRQDCIPEVRANYLPL